MQATGPSGQMDRLTEEMDDWGAHWLAYDASTRMNPAQMYRRALIFSQLERTVSVSSPLRVLDVGCGQGDFLAEARERFSNAELAGIDLSEVGLELTRKRALGAKLYCADFSATDPFPSELAGFASHAVCSEVLEHLEKPEILLQKLKPLLSPEGVLIVTVPGGPRSAFDLSIGHRRHYSPVALEELFVRSGYQPVVAEGAGFPFFNLYKLALTLRGKRLIEDVKAVESKGGPSQAALLVMAAFRGLFKLNTDRTRLGWQTFGVFKADTPPLPRPCRTS